MSDSARCPTTDNGALFACQGQLPRLPVPDLDATLAKYARSLEPLLQPDELTHSKSLIEEFKRSAQGRELQQRLESRAADPSCANWLEDWWNNLSYMGYRDPVIPYVSYHYSFSDDPGCSTAVERAAKLIDGAIAFRQQVVDGSLEPDMTRTTPLCSHSYNFMFNACRIPSIPSDHCQTSTYNGNETVVVVRGGQFFVFSFLRNGSQLSVDEIAATLEQIVQVADANTAEPIGILTADNRDSWARNRKVLLGLPGNKDLLDSIEASAFLVVLEKERPVTREEFSHAVWHGSGRNRWFDKPCQFVVCDNARAGFCGEHSMMDGTPTLRLVESAIAYASELPTPSAARAKRDPELRALHFQTSSAIVSAVKQAETLFATAVSKQHLRVLCFDAFGKERIKQLGCSPDAFIQLVIQLAYTRLHGHARPTYESSMTRKFLHGRTETCRSVTCDSVVWCASMADQNTDNAARIKLFRDALATHSLLVKEAVNGQGVDRHLLGLRMLVKQGEEMPGIFEDPAYSYSSHWYLSTSQVSSENFTSYGWSEVTPKGYGIAYNICKNCLIIHIICMRNEYGLDSDRLARSFETAAKDVHDMLSGSPHKQ
ncbi:Carnitine O-acetyltransferase mitochondrial [Coemansia sp. RSA 1365]|nr:Carnitine O-acetyltransferase mitochondrial [Coemansia sp. RSA 1365]